MLERLGQRNIKISTRNVTWALFTVHTPLIIQESQARQTHHDLMRTHPSLGSIRIDD